VLHSRDEVRVTRKRTAPPQLCRMSATPVRYTVTATLSSPSVLEEYLDWLRNGHVQAVVAGGAEVAEVCVVDDPDKTQVDSSYVFPSREVMQAYFDGPAIALREDGKLKFVDTGKVTFARRISEIRFRA
jgi:Domain of unknown function (DUF4286)